MTALYLLRHGETAWSLSGRHTGNSEIPLTPKGEQEAFRAGQLLKDLDFATVFSSPRIRAQRTCDLAGLGTPEIVDDLHEWDYGDYEGLLIEEIWARFPGWNVFEHGCPGGEMPAEVSDRADRVLAMAREIDGNVIFVSHGHFTRALAIRWMGLPIYRAGSLDSATASISILGTDKNGANVLKLWNRT